MTNKSYKHVHLIKRNMKKSKTPLDMNKKNLLIINKQHFNTLEMGIIIFKRKTHRKIPKNRYFNK